MLRDHDYMLRDLMQEVEQLKDKTNKHDKQHKATKKAIDHLNELINECKQQL